MKVDYYEYGVAHTSDLCGKYVDDVHRLGMTEFEANLWINQWEEDGGKAGAFVKIRRPVCSWEVVE